MPEWLTSDCMLACSFGSDPAPFQALEMPGKPTIAGLAAATILEIVPEDNVPSFIMCSSEENPDVALATELADGVLTPMPCTPIIADPWEPGSTIAKFQEIPLATVASKCQCSWGGGEISVVTPGQFGVADGI